MTTTPVKWKDSFVVNAGFTSGGQTVPQTIGLKNGNILVVWEEDNGNTNGPSAGVDVIARFWTRKATRSPCPFSSIPPS